MLNPPLATDEALRRLKLLLSSFHRLTGGHLIERGYADPWQACWTAPRVIVAHGTETDPIFFYGNQLALELFELDFTAFTQLPSRYSAEALLREERAVLLDRVREHGFIDDYAGVRVSATGKRFRIEQAVV
ncbi:MAG TPA: MEKHLA domain-containing protein, partial [Polyangiaceae bacterium]|nr:MEKHLA domain-containing protein [Polyangiaceae bacterium]